MADPAMTYRARQAKLTGGKGTGAIALLASLLLAWLATPAVAETLELKNESTGNHCSAVSLSGTDVDGGCLTHATSNAGVVLRKHVFGIESNITTCDNEFAGRLSEDAEGYLLEQVLTGAGCSRQACKPSSEATPWAAHGFEGTPQGVTEGDEYLTMNFCAEPVGGGTDETCEIDVPFQTYEQQHRQEYGHTSEMGSHGISGFRCELVGHWTSETGGTHDGAAEQQITLGDPAQELWLDSSYSDPADEISSSDYGTNIDLTSGSVTFDTANDVTCDEAFVQATVVENAAPPELAIGSVLLSGCEDSGNNDVEVFTDTATPWTATWSDIDTFTLTGVLIQLVEPSSSRTCTYGNSGSPFLNDWTDAASSTLMSSGAPLTKLAGDAGCASSGTTGATYTISASSGPNSNLWLE